MEMITINQSKKVLASDPYRPREGMRTSFVGRTYEMKVVTASWIGGSSMPPLCPLLVGEPGVGKNRLVYELSRRSGLDLYIFQGHEDVTAEDMACTVRFSDEPGRNMDYMVSPLVTAMHRGGICFIDEIGKIRPRALALLASVLDERRYIDSTLLGERVYANPRFRFIAATNTGEVAAMPEFIRSRMRPVVQVDHPPKEEINQIINQQTADEPHLQKLVALFWKLFAKIKHAPSPRDAVHLFALASSLRDYDLGMTARVYDSSHEDHGNPGMSEHADYPITETHLNEAFQQLFKQETP